MQARKVQLIVLHVIRQARKKEEVVMEMVILPRILLLPTSRALQDPQPLPTRQT